MSSVFWCLHHQCPPNSQLWFPNILLFSVLEDALDTAWVNVHKMDVNNVDLVNVDIQSLQLARGECESECRGYIIRDHRYFRLFSCCSKKLCSYEYVAILSSTLLFIFSSFDLSPSSKWIPREPCPSFWFSGFDTVIMNPPFGTRNTGIDSQFVSIAMRHATTVYSLHKTSTRDVRTCSEMLLGHRYWCTINCDS